MNFKEINILDLGRNAFELIGKDWMLITAGSEEKMNTMTASWGGVGVLWNKNVSFIFVRPQRYTLEFLELNDYYTLSFFGGDYKKILTYCGRNSGRDVDKVRETGLNVVFDKAPYFNEAKLVLVCKKLHAQYIDPNGFNTDDVKNNYKSNDYHKMFVGEIIKCLVRE